MANSKNKNKKASAKGHYKGKREDVINGGFSTKTGPGGAIYTGEFKEGKLNGQGTFINANGDKYIGEFKEGLPNGYGVFNYSTGDEYVGEFKDGSGFGYGTLTCASGIKYAGEFNAGQPHGQGTLIHENGDKYVGEFRDGAITGNGVYYNEELSNEEITIDSLGEVLKKMYDSAQKGEKTTMIHLFGVKYAEEIISNRYAPKDILQYACIPETYQTEINKGVRLAKYVVLK
ncbi:MAG: MORN repeat-containing protein [Clostridiaceae bacterium]